MGPIVKKRSANFTSNENSTEDVSSASKKRKKLKVETSSLNATTKNSNVSPKKKQASKKRPVSLSSNEKLEKDFSSSKRKQKKVGKEIPKKNNESLPAQKKSNEVKSSPKSKFKQKNAKCEVKTKGKKEPSESILGEDLNNLDVAQLLALGENSSEISCKNNEILSDDRSTSDSDMSDFEEVKETLKTEPVIPKEGVNITLEVPNVFNRHKKKGIDLEAHLKRQMNKVKKNLQVLMHKVHLLCWIAHLRFVNNILNSPTVMEKCMPLIKSKSLYPSKHSDLSYLEGILKWFHKTIVYKKDCDDPLCTGGLLKEIVYQFEKKQAFSSKAFIFMFIVLLRVLGVKVRIIMSFQVMPIRPSHFELFDKINKKEKECKNIGEGSGIENNEEEEKEKINVLNKNTKIKTSTRNKNLQNKSKEPENNKKNIKKEQEVNSDDEFERSEHFKPSIKSGKEKAGLKAKQKKVSETSSGKKSGSSKRGKANTLSTDNDFNDDDEEDDDFKPNSLKKKEIKKKGDKKQNEDEGSSKKKEGFDVWGEVYLEAEEKWISVDVLRQKIHCVGELYSKATHPVVYVIAGNNDLTLKDVTKRYVPNWHSDTRKRRVDEAWWNDTMKPYLPCRNAQDREEDEDINRQLSDKPLPVSISEYKDHPLYALKRHLLKFEAIYPSDAPTLGFVRGEPVYARECVVTLRSREIWYKEARLVRLKEEPYKIVKARPKYDKMTGEVKKDLPLELFGFWQTEPYIPPVAVDGKVPRNEYGNVDLFKPCMLPIGTVHLQIPSLIRVAKKLGIDCAPATVGFDYHSGGSHPVFDGFVVCEEFKETLLDHWNKEIDESAKRSEERKEKRVYGNWKRLIKGLLIREKLKVKYAFGENSDEEASTSKTSKSFEPEAV